VAERRRETITTRRRVLPLCLRPWTTFEIDDGAGRQGLVRPCCWAAVDVGDLNTQRPRDIWNGPGYVEFRRRMLAGDIQDVCPDHCPFVTPSARDRGGYRDMHVLTYLRRLVRRPRANSWLNLAEIAGGATRLRSMPVDIKLTPTLACNQRCVMCFQDHNPRAVLSEQALEDVLALLPGAQLLRLQGGELLAAAEGLTFLERLAGLRRRPPISLVTNGTFPAERAWSLLAGLKLDWVVVSVDAANPETYELIHRSRAWHDVVANARRLRDLAQVHRLGRFRVLLNFTLMTLNWREAPSFVRLAASLGLDVSFNPLIHPEELAVLGRPNAPEGLGTALDEALGLAEQARLWNAQVTLRGLIDMTRGAAFEGTSSRCE